MLLGFLPQLDVDNCCIAQTGSVVRALANHCKLDGKTPMDCAKADMIYECCNDTLGGNITSIHRQNVARLTFAVNFRVWTMQVREE